MIIDMKKADMYIQPPPLVSPFPPYSTLQPSPLPLNWRFRCLYFLSVKKLNILCLNLYLRVSISKEWSK